MITIAKRITDTIPTSEEEDEIFQAKKSRGESSGVLLVELVVFIIKAIMITVEALLRALIPPVEKQLFNQVVLVTGSGHGIGRELALRFAAHGSTVICWDRDEMANRETLKMIQTMGYNRVHAYTCDVSKRQDVLSLAKKVEEEVGKVTILVNNAGVMSCRPILDQDPNNVRKAFDVNVLAHFWTIEAFLPTMMKTNAGHVVAISSMCGIIGLPNAVPYTASKFAVRGLMEALSEEIRTTDPNSRLKFTTVYPFTVDTGLVQKPKNRFPSLTPVLSPEEVAAEVVRAVRQELKEISVPGSLLNVDRIARLLPTKLVQHTKDFIGSGVDPEDKK